MEPDFWLTRWRDGNTPWHREGANPHLQALAAELSRPGQRVLVPMCGASHDVWWLVEHGYEVVGVELSPIAVEALFQGAERAPRRRCHGRHEVYEDRGVAIWCGDLFQLGHGDLGRIDGVFDRGALVALPPEQRSRYVAHLDALTGGAAVHLLVALEYPENAIEGPPFSVPEAEVLRHYAPPRRCRRLSRVSVIEREPGLAARGLTELHEHVWMISTG